jgi:UDP-N-acetylglucosamine--N-acetylmuramyl-(pentapeptide) pyrophosphoryl-undecaprenol N-acetylglucosamine transferase
MERQGQPRYRVEAYIDMPVALAAAELVISRSGASTIAEITAVGLPSILFPYPHAYADHQTTNAKCLVEPGAAVLCNDASTTPKMLAGIISELRGNPDKLATIAAASAALGKPDAAEHVARIAIAEC